MSDSVLEPYDALMLVSYGGPNGPEDVLPFLRNATGGAGIPDERLEQVGGHYRLFGGVSPINARNQELLDGLRARLGEDIRYGIGNRNWHPYFTETLAELAAGGARRILTLFTSAYTSYSGCRQYRENLAAALDEFHESHPDVRLRLDRVRAFANTPGFVGANARAVADALARFNNERTALRGGPDGTFPPTSDSATEAPQIPPHTHLVFVTHSIPLEMALHSGPAQKTAKETGTATLSSQTLPATLSSVTTPERSDPTATPKPALFEDRDALGPNGDLSQRNPDFTTQDLSGLLPVTREQDVLGEGWTYLAQHLAVAGAINRRLAATGSQLPWTLAFCSRSGSPRQKWLEPDINDHLKDLAAAGVENVVVAPIGFISDHMEVVYDLDTEAFATASELGLNYQRAATAESNAGFLDGLAELVRERAALARGERPNLVVEPGTYPAFGENCGPDCCQYPRPSRAHTKARES